jgi:uncharacterized protein (DUF4415 family)
VHTIDESDAFEWDEAKGEANSKKHGVKFPDAVGVFTDERAITMPDLLTAVDEQRLLTLGRDRLGRLHMARRPHSCVLGAEGPAARAAAIPGDAMNRFEDEYDFSKGKRGPVLQIPPGKTRITIRIDDDILAWFHERVNAAGGGNYQTLMNQALRNHIDQGALEKTLRRVIREELRKTGTKGRVPRR